MPANAASLHWTGRGLRGIHLGRRVPPARLRGAGRARFPWQFLHDPLGANGEARLDRQFFRANVDPSERYVLSVPGSAARRLRTDGAGLANVFLAGDWLRTGLDCGCVEAAVMGGMQAARHIRPSRSHSRRD